MNGSKKESLLIVCLITGGLLAALTACKGGDSPGTISLPPEGGQIEVRPGDTLELTLEGNPTTGYNWEIEALDETILKLEGKPVFEPESDLIGAPSAITIHFKAVKAGHTTLSMIYRRSWEEGVAPARTYQVDITVKP